MMNRPAAIAFTLALLHVPHVVDAQTTADRGSITINGDFLVASSFSSVAHPLDFAEAATVQTDYRMKSAPAFDIGARAHVWRNLGVGVDVSRFTKSSGASVSAQVPHPFYFNRSRAVSGDAGGLKREETGVHVQAVWLLPETRSRWRAAVFGGPSLISVRQDLINDVTIAQSYPYDSASFTGIVSERRSTSRLGFNVGGDVTYLFARHAGVDIAAAYTHARVRLSSSSGDAAAIDAGGPHVGGGLRFRF